MTRALAILFVPAVLVVLGYSVVLHSMGLEPGYLRLFLALALFLGAAWWISRSGRPRAPKDAKSGPDART